MTAKTDVTRTELVLLVSCLVVGFGAALPWVSARVAAGPADVGASATGIERLGVVTLTLAVVGIAVLLSADVDDLTPVVTAAVGAVILLIGLWRLIDLGGPVSPGIGLYLTVSGGLGITGVGTWTHRIEDGRSTAEATGRYPRYSVR